MMSISCLLSPLLLCAFPGVWTNPMVDRTPFCSPPSQSFHPVALVSCTSGLFLNIRGLKKSETCDSLHQKGSKKIILTPCKPVSARNYSSVPDLRSSNPSCSEPEFHRPNSKIKEVKSAFVVNIVSSAQVRRGPRSGSGRASLALSSFFCP